VCDETATASIVEIHDGVWRSTPAMRARGDTRVDTRAPGPVRVEIAFRER